MSQIGGVNGKRGANIRVGEVGFIMAVVEAKVSIRLNTRLVGGEA